MYEDDSYGNFVDDVAWLQTFVENEYPREESLYDKNLDSVTLFRTTDSRYWASRKAIFKCSDNPGKDPLVVLEELENEYNIEYVFVKQPINKKHYQICYETIQNIIKNFKKERRA